MDNKDFYIEVNMRCEGDGNLPTPAIAIRTCYGDVVSAWYDVSLTQRT